MAKYKAFPCIHIKLNIRIQIPHQDPSPLPWNKFWQSQYNCFCFQHYFFPSMITVTDCLIQIPQLEKGALYDLKSNPFIALCKYCV